MDVVVYALCKKMVSTAVSKIGNIFDIKGKVPTFSDLPMEGNKQGDLYLVGPKIDDSYDEYYWTSDGFWDFIGSTGPDTSEFLTDVGFYTGNDYTGTLENPAQGTILATIYEILSSKYVEQQDGYSLISQQELEKLQTLPIDAMSEEEADAKYVSWEDYDLEIF